MSALLTEPFGATFMYNAAASPHAEHASTLLVGLDSDVVVDSVRGRAVLVPPDATYSACASGPTLTFTFDPELCPQVATQARANGMHALSGSLARTIVGAVRTHASMLSSPEVLRGLGGELARHLALGSAPRIDRRIARLLEELRDPDVPHAGAIARTRLSPAHVQALFARDVGMRIRTYILWRRLLHGIGRVGPLDLTAAAHAAGFADLAHFSRTCRRMLGYSPSALRANLITR